MRIPDDLIPLAREQAREHLRQLEIDRRLMTEYLCPNHPRRVCLEHRLQAARRLCAILSAERAAA